MARAGWTGSRSATKQLVATLAWDGETVLLHGPVGIGKTHLLQELERRAAAEARPCGMSNRTASLGDVTFALAHAYPSVCDRDASQRELRGGLRLAVERQPGLLLLDGLREVTLPMRAYLRSLRGTGLGVVLAADTHHPRDRDRLRDYRLTHREIELPRLGSREVRVLLEQALGSCGPPVPAVDRALVGLVRGRPGWVEPLTRRLRDRRYWDKEHLRLATLGADVMIEMMGRTL